MTRKRMYYNSATTGSDLTGGGISCWSSSPIIRNNKIIGNSAGVGGGIGLDYFSSATVQNNEIIKNWATIWGSGGICCDRSSSPTIINNTVSGNESTSGFGAISCTSNSYSIVLNTILWGNSPEEIFVDASSGINITYSDIKGGWPGEGNIDADPLFVDPRARQFSLLKIRIRY